MSTAHSVIRDTRHVERDECRYLKVVWQREGSTCVENSEGSILINPHHWAIYDTSRPYAFHMSENCHFQMMLVPFEDAHKLARHVANVTKILMQNDPATEIARSNLTNALASHNALNTEAQVVIQDSTLALLGIALGNRPLPKSAPPLDSESRLSVAQSVIEEALSNQDLNPDQVALSCKMSRRSLYNVFNIIGTTPQAYITRRRLDRAREMLTNSEQQISLTSLAYQLGFSDAAHFSRLFKKTYGKCPSQWS
ncbi:Transcriptional activator NphR [compost metagenome]